MFQQVLKAILIVVAVPIIANCYNRTTPEEGLATVCPSFRRFCLALDLKDDPNLIADYEKFHRNVWPEIKQSILASGIMSMQIYRIMNRLFMIMEVDDSFSFEKKAATDANNPKVKEWETLMWKFQQALPIAKPGEKWMLMDKIYDLDS